jgi:ketosteroid isomerase-like protein
MPSENVTLLMEAFEAFGRGDMDAVAERIDPEFRIEDRILIEPDPAERGPAALLANIELVREAFGDMTWEPQEVLEHDDKIAVRVRATGSGQTTSLLFEEDIGHVYTLRDGRAIKLDIFRTWPEARAAAGLED